jgi:hypothetical protein
MLFWRVAARKFEAGSSCWGQKQVVFPGAQLEVEVASSASCAYPLAQ